MTLKAKQIEHASDGMHADGNGLYLRVKNGKKSWIFRYQLKGRRREMGIGTLQATSVTLARSKAAQLSVQVKNGIDPIEYRRNQELAQERDKNNSILVTFSEVAEEYIDSHQAGWTNIKHAKQWETTLTKYAFPVIGKKSVAEITTDDVLQILKPIWNDKTETASRLRSRIELILSYAKAKKLRFGENPAVWRGHLDALLPKASRVKKVRHHPALTHQRIKDFLALLRVTPGIGARALELAILTATRSQEVRFAKWNDFDFENAVWTNPPSNMKAKKEHRVPLSPQVIAYLKQLPRIEGTDLLFPTLKTLKPISDMTLTQVIRRINERSKGVWIDQNGDVITAHGFRSTFRDWAGETTNHAREVVEHALAHRLPDKAEAAYARGTLFDKRKSLMNDWADYCYKTERSLTVL